MTRDTVRFYERQGLLPSAPRPALSNEYKAYNEGTVRRLLRIRYAKGLGFTLTEIRPMLGDWLGGTADKGLRRRALAKKLLEVEAQQLELELLGKALKAQLGQLL